MKLPANRSIGYLFILLMLIALGGCNLVLTHDIVMQDAESGVITLTADITYNKEYDSSNPPEEEYPLHGYVEFANEFDGIEIIDETSEDLSDETDFHYIYTIKAKFADLDELGQWIAIQDGYGIEAENDEETTTLKVYPQQFFASSQEVLDEVFGSYSMADIVSNVNITTPNYIKDTDEAAEVTQDGKTARWQIEIDEDFYEGEDILWSIAY